MRYLSSCRIVNLKGLEPPTFWSVARCSIQLSYRSCCLCGRKYNNIFILGNITYFYLSQTRRNILHILLIINHKNSSNEKISRNNYKNTPGNYSFDSCFTSYCSLYNVSVVGVKKFENDTLADFRSFDLVFNLSSLFKKSGYEVNSIVIDRAVVNVIVKKEGKANRDVMKDTSKAAVATETKPSSSGMKIRLKKVSVL